MNKWIYVDGRAKRFESGEEFIKFFKERIDEYNKKQAEQ